MFKLYGLLVGLLFLSACNPVVEEKPENIDPLESTPHVDLSVNDFTPPTEVDRGMGDAGPFEMRLLSAHSEDGITWERDNVILSEQANVPDMVITEDGTILLYYVGGNIMGKDESMAVAVSQDDGVTWSFKSVIIEGAEQIGSNSGDPDIILLDDGTFRLYFTAQIKNSDGPGIQYAEGTDGLTFSYKGQALKDEETMTIDSSVYRIGDEWRMNTFSDFETTVIQAQSQDEGESFEIVKMSNITYNKVPYFLSNPFTLPDGSVRMWSFQLYPTSQFRSFVTTDGLNWEDEGHVYLSYEEGANELEGFYIKDPVVVQLPDGSYFMVYVTRAPY